MGRDRSRRVVFDEVAELYDAVRPGYPEALIDEICAYAALPEHGRILEIGCGPGKATLPFARRGHAMVCVELGKNLAAVARRNLEPYPQVEVKNLAFEGFREPPESFDLVLAASALHWIDPAVGYPKAWRALRPGGALALVWNLHPGAENDFQRRVLEIYGRVVPELAKPDKVRPLQTRIEERRKEIEATGLFQDVEVHRRRFDTTVDADTYLRIHDTYSDHRVLPQEVKERLYEEIRALIERLGGQIVRPYESTAFLARKRPVEDPHDLDPVEVVDHDPEWERSFERKRDDLFRAAGRWLESVEHVGSTAVAGLAAKPVLDILASVARKEDADAAVPALESLGYEYRGEAGIEGRRFFRKFEDGVRRVHLHLYERSNPEVGRHLRFRDLLRADPELRSGYDALKRDLALRFPYDRERYTEAKGPFILKALEGSP